MTLQEATSQLHQSFRTYKQVKKDGSTLRQTWMEDLASALASTGKTDAATHLTNLLRREQQRRMFRHIKYVSGQLRLGSVTSVIAPLGQDQAWIEVSTKLDIERACLEENERRFRQANGTPFMVEPLRSLIGDMGIGPTADAILSGTFIIPDGTDPFAAKLLPFLAMSPAIRDSLPIATTIDTPTYMAGWQRAKERTSSGPSGLHFGHFKAGCQHPLVADFDATMVQIPYATGFSPQRWQHGTNVEIEKKKGNFRVDALRTILLFEADFNAMNKLLGRELMSHAEKHHQLAPEQYGSRKHLSASDHCLNKRLTFDLTRQTRTPGILCANNAKSCYDRIVHSVATLCMRRLGVPEAPIVSMFSSIQNMKNYVRTAYGDSTQSFGGTNWTIPIHGVGQGNGAGPAIWAAVSTPILNMMRDAGFGTTFRSALTGEVIHFVGYAFVDDTDLCQTCPTPDSSYREVLSTMQDALCLWEGGIKATGGAIVPAKTHWYLIDFQWTDGKWAYSSDIETPGELQVRDAVGVPTPLERVPVTEARRTLGVRLAPDGNNRAEVEYLRQQAVNWSDKLRTGHLPRYASWVSMNATIMRTLIYPLPATTLTYDECHYILSPVLQAGLPSSGIARTFPRTIVHAPLQFNGLALPHLYTEQGLSHILQILRHLHVQDSITGQLLRASLQQLQLEFGLPESFFTSDYQSYQHLATDCWLKHTWKFCDDYSITLKESAPILPLRRQHDQHLTSAFFAAGYRKADLLTLNRCRVFLQAVTLSDIATGDGHAISGAAWNGMQDPYRPQYFHWPRQGRPSTRDWGLWQRALLVTFGVHSSRRTLSLSLGSWLDSDEEWPWFYSSQDARLYQRSNTGWNIFSRCPGRASRASSSRFHSQPFLLQHLADLPPDLIRTTIFRTGTIFHHGGTSPTLHPDIIPAAFSFRQFVSQLAPAARWAVDGFSSSDAGHAVSQAIHSHMCIAVSDGLFKAEHGTASWVLEGQQPMGRIVGDTLVPGAPDAQSAFRSELTGLFSIAIMVQSLCEFYSITSGTVEIGCDGLEALHRTCSPHFHPAPTDAHYDLITATRSVMASCPIQWLYRHVKGHQDDNLGHSLDRWALLNIEMDYRAKVHWSNTQSIPHSRKSFDISGEPWSVWLGNEKLSTNLREAVLTHIHGQEALQWWTTKQRILATEAANIDWPAIKSAMKNSPLSRHHWVSKHTTGICGIGVMMK